MKVCMVSDSHDRADARLVNPGTVAGLAARATWALGDLAAMRFEVFSMAV